MFNYNDFNIYIYNYIYIYLDRGHPYVFNVHYI